MGLLRDFNLLCQFNLQSMFEKPTVQNYICLVAAFSARVPSFVFIPRLRASDTESIQFCRFQTETQNCTDVSAFINTNNAPCLTEAIKLHRNNCERKGNQSFRHIY